MSGPLLWAYCGGGVCYAGVLLSGRRSMTLLAVTCCAFLWPVSLALVLMEDV